MTVSRVINSEANVRESTREAVNAAIQELGYSPNKAARSLASASQIQVGLLYDNPSSAYLSAMLLGVLEQARQSDTQVVVVECETEADGLKAIRSMVKGGVDGIIVPPPLADSVEILKRLRQTDVLAVTIGTRHDKTRISSVMIDDYQAAREMTEHVIGLGHRRVGFIIGSREQHSSLLRLRGFRDAMQAAGLDVPDDLIIQGEFSYRSGLDAAERLLHLAERPTAIFASNDDMAAATVATAHRYHIDVPGDLTVVGFDDTLLATTIWPEITTIRQPISRMARAAIQMLERAILNSRSGLDSEVQHQMLEFRMVRRESDGPPPAVGRSALRDTGVRAEGGTDEASRDERT